MRSSAFTANTNALASDMNLLRADAQGASFLLVNQQASPGLTVQVQAGVVYIGATKVTYAGGNSGSFTAPVTNPRIDILTIDTAGTLAITQGTEAGSPTAPTYPSDKMVLCEVYNRVGQTIIYDNANQTAGQGYITDARRFLQTVNPANTDLSAQVKGVLYTNSTRRPQIHVLSIAMTANNGSARVTATIDGTGGAPIGTTVCEATLSNPAATVLATEVVLTFFVKVGGTYYIDSGVTGSSSIGSVVAWRAITF